jgi:hypothetical protein
LTLDVYTHVGLHDERRAIEKMPQLHDPDDKKDAGKNRALVLKTGTDNKPIDAAQDSTKELTPNLTPKLTPTAFSGCDQSAPLGNESGKPGEKNGIDNSLTDGNLDAGCHPLTAVGTGEEAIDRSGVEPPTEGFEILLGEKQNSRRDTWRTEDFPLLGGISEICRARNKHAAVAFDHV